MGSTLLEKLFKIPRGEVKDQKDISHIEKVVYEHWDEMELTNDFTSMKGEKLIGRMEKIQWNPPKLSFIIERHGGTVLGSSRAELYQWTVDTSSKTATCEKSGHRQLKPMSERYNAAKDAQEIVELILSGSQDVRLTWKDNNRIVVVKIKEIVPTGGSNQTELARRKKFRNECERLITEHGWQVVRYNTYKKTSDE